MTGGTIFIPEDSFEEAADPNAWQEGLTKTDASIRLLAETENRTTRVLPNPDNSCASDS